jgi:hypothetical protein
LAFYITIREQAFDLTLGLGRIYHDYL